MAAERNQEPELEDALPPAIVVRAEETRGQEFQINGVSYLFLTEKSSTLQGQVILAERAQDRVRTAIKLSRVELVRRRVNRGGSPILEDVENERFLLARIADARNNELRERRNMVGNVHPSDFIIRLLDIADNDFHLFTVMEFCDGGELLGLIQRRGPLLEPDARRLFTEMMRAIDWLHRQDICHLDISPENILLDANNHVRICDFGVAREMQRAEADGRLLVWEPIGPGPQPGKIPYMAPEILEGKLPFDGAQADLYCCGMVLGLMLFGGVPYPKASPVHDNFRRVIEGDLAGLVEDWRLPLHPNAVNVLQRLLCPAGQRLTFDEFVEEPWFAQEYPPLSP